MNISEIQYPVSGLTAAEVLQSRKLNGSNRLDYKKASGLSDALKGLAKEPMVILLLVASAIYFISGNIGDGIFLAVAIVLVAAISLYQDRRSRMALEKLKTYTQPACKVVRDNEIKEIPSTDLVVGDCLLIEEGTLVAADGRILHSNDFSVNESILTGESLPVFKDSSSEQPMVYLGTTVTSGLAIAEITAIGHQTALGRIGKSLDDIKEERTPLEQQITNFVRKMVIIGALVFLVVWAINFFKSYHLLDSLLKALTLAMSILPEEIPVAFTTFMALGAWRLMNTGIVVKQMKTVETLGSATVICADKTGTLTENSMSLEQVYLPAAEQVFRLAEAKGAEADHLLQTAMWASEPIPFDPMEAALHNSYQQRTSEDKRRAFSMVHEYPLGGKPPMMTHIFENNAGERIIAAKGAPEALIPLCNLSDQQINAANAAVEELSKAGYRVLAVADANWQGNAFPQKQQDFPFTFRGIVGFNDPPKKNTAAVLKQFYQAGIAVKIITGDNAATTAAIARQVGLQHAGQTMSGTELIELPDDLLRKRVAETAVFTRMFPEAKLKIINALKANHEIVAMTGDGVNDGPALKAAHIGIAMGKKGTEIAKQAASLILVNDDLAQMVEAVAIGRRIYTNLKKAIQYIISIHIPIILTVFIPLALGWIFPNIFSPTHIIFLELIMGPTCSIIYENEPMEKNTMTLPPRPITDTFFNWKELTTSIIQGLVITAGTLFAYQYAVQQGYSESLTRTMVFTTLIAANIFLTLVNRSFYYSLLTTILYRNNLVLLIIGATVGLMALLLAVPAMSRFFQFEQLSGSQLLICVLTGFISVVWFEIVKAYKRRQHPYKHMVAPPAETLAG